MNETLHGADIQAVTLAGIGKAYPGIRALDNVSLDLRPGEIHGLVGENGAGKSTLIRIIAGVHPPDEGSYSVRGFSSPPSGPHEAREMGIAVVHQEPTLIPTFSVAENVLADRTTGRSLQVIDRRRLERDAAALLTQVGLKVDPSASINRLSRAQRQLVEIARALSARAQVLLLDEPTASISLTESASLHAILRRLKNEGVAVLYVSHKIEDVLALCDVVTVLRDGSNAGSPGAPVRDLTVDDLVSRMIGRTDELPRMPERNAPAGEPVLEAVGLTSDESPVPISFALRSGEILGWYGLVGSGRSEIARCLMGLDARTGGRLLVGGQEVASLSPSSAIRRWNIGYVSESRHEEGLFLEHSVARNVSAASWRSLRGRLRLFSPRQEKSVAERFRTSLAIRARSVDQTVSTLSGGNQQKVSISKWLATTPRILIVDEPTVGIDVHTKFEVHALLGRMAIEGIGVIVISSDLAEVVRVSDRVLVFRAAAVVADLANSHNYEEMSDLIMRTIVARSRKTAAATEGVG